MKRCGKITTLNGFVPLISSQVISFRHIRRLFQGSDGILSLFFTLNNWIDLDFTLLSGPRLLPTASVIKIVSSHK